jgi:hypothetical protein
MLFSQSFPLNQINQHFTATPALLNRGQPNRR